MPISVADRGGLEPPGFHGAWSAYARRIWERRAYLWHVPMNDLRSQQMNSVLGNLWHLLNPTISIAVYYLVFGVVLQTDRGVDNFIAFLAVGVFAFQYTQRATTSGANSIVRNHGLIRSINFPRAIIPISAVITELFAFLPGVFVFVVVCIASGEPITLRWLALPLLIVGQTLFNSGAASLAARATSAFRDVRNLLPFLFRLLFYASGILFSADAYLDDDGARWLFILNPTFVTVELYRWAMVGQAVGTAEVVSFICWAIGLSVVGIAWFRRGESTYGA